jgi:TPR repeat protein
MAQMEFVKAAELGDPEAMGNLAYTFLISGSDPNLKKLYPSLPRLVSYAKASAMRGIPEGQRALGTFYRKGIGVRKNLALAEINLKLASEKKNIADGELYLLYEDDFQDSSMSKLYRNKILESKNGFAINSVLGEYCRGNSLSSWSAKCVSWVKESALSETIDKGISQMMYGILLFSGESNLIFKDRIEGLSYILASSLKGNKMATDIYEASKSGFSQNELFKINNRANEINSK